MGPFPPGARLGLTPGNPTAFLWAGYRAWSAQAQPGASPERQARSQPQTSAVSSATLTKEHRNHDLKPGVLQGFPPLISWWFCFPHNSERVRQICQIVSLMAPSGGQQVGTGGWTLATAKNRAIKLAVTGDGGSLRSRDRLEGLIGLDPPEPLPSKKRRNQC